jgi:uncharacterized protein YjiS (DUF1127 family)
MSKLMNRPLRLLSRAVSAAITQWIKRERAIRELSMLGERELAELGITPAMIPYVASPKFTTEPADDRGHPTANDNRAHCRDAANS